jgi:hypothetical protein
MLKDMCNRVVRLEHGRIQSTWQDPSGGELYPPGASIPLKEQAL